MKTREPRYKVLNIRCDIIANMFIDGNLHVIDLLKCQYDIPDDVEYIRCYQNIVTDCFSFLLYHKSWDIVPEGGIYPTIYSESYSEKMDRINPNWRDDLPPISEAISCESSILDNPWVPEDFQSAVSTKNESKVMNHLECGMDMKR